MFFSSFWRKWIIGWIILTVHTIICLQNFFFLSLYHHGQFEMVQFLPRGREPWWDFCECAVMCFAATWLREILWVPSLQSMASRWFRRTRWNISGAQTLNWKPLGYIYTKFPGSSRTPPRLMFTFTPRSTRQLRATSSTLVATRLQTLRPSASSMISRDFHWAKPSPRSLSLWTELIEETGPWVCCMLMLSILGMLLCILVFCSFVFMQFTIHLLFVYYF